MEADLGCRLFERDRRSVRLTAAGQRFQAYARQALTEWQRLSGELRLDPSELRGEISVYFGLCLPRTPTILRNGTPRTGIRNALADNLTTAVQMPEEYAAQAVAGR